MSYALRGRCLCRIHVSQTVINDVTSKFENQSVEELARQKIKIQDMLDSGKASVDSEFWEAVLKELHVFQVKRCSSLELLLDMLSVVLVFVRCICWQALRLIVFECIRLWGMYSGLQVPDVGFCCVTNTAGPCSRRWCMRSTLTPA